MFGRRNGQHAVNQTVAEPGQRSIAKVQWQCG